MTDTLYMLMSLVINCTTLTVNPGGPLRMSSCAYHYGAQCNFSCMTGHRFNGSSTLTCVAPGNKPPGLWDNPLPSCQGMLWRKQFLPCDTYQGYLSFKIDLVHSKYKTIQKTTVRG